jgi:hypothetical protein
MKDVPVPKEERPPDEIYRFTERFIIPALEDADTPQEARDYIKEQVALLNDISERLKCLFYIQVNSNWKHCLDVIYEMTTRLKKYGFPVPADVPPNSTVKAANIDLTTTDKCCVCPVFYAGTDIEGKTYLTNLVNRPPVDMKAKWVNKYAAKDMILSVQNPALPFSNNYVKFPKRRVEIWFTNYHKTTTAFCWFYAEYLEMDYDDAIWLMENVWEPMVEELTRYIMPRPKKE